MQHVTEARLAHLFALESEAMWRATDSQWQDADAADYDWALIRMAYAMARFAASLRRIPFGVSLQCIALRAEDRT